MNRAELKSKAKELVRGNKWYILKPVVIIGLIIVIIEAIAAGLDFGLGFAKVETVTEFGMTSTRITGGYITLLVGIFTGFASSALSVAYAHYILSFVRGKRLELSDVIDFMKKNWWLAFVVGLISGLIVLGCSILFLIPGIIASVGLTYYQEVCADNLDMKATEIIKKAWNMTKGHKLDLFVLSLSFIGWTIVASLTFGILYIWLTPYMTITFTLFYEQIKK